MAVTFTFWFIALICGNLNTHTHRDREGERERHTGVSRRILLKTTVMIVLMSHCVCVRENVCSHFGCSRGVVVFAVEVVLVRFGPAWQQDVHIQKIVRSSSTGPVLSYSLVHNYSSLERKLKGQNKKD